VELAVNDATYADLADELAVEPAALRAIVAVESSGSPLLAEGSTSPRGQVLSGLPVIQFEGHVFWRRLEKLRDTAYDPRRLTSDPATCQIIDSTGKPIGERLLADILYPSLDMSKMRRPPAEWDQLAAARAIHEGEANQSASWGAFQIMGFNWPACAGSLAEFLELSSSVPGQVRLFTAFIQADRKLLAALRNRDWRQFATIYNGSQGVRNGYDLKMARAFERERARVR
jgi:hypothetical protein